MTKNFSTKRALLTSVLSLLLCVVMLAGTTFAWFTDAATTGVNTIQSGNLDVVLEMWDGEKWVNAEGETLDFVAKDGHTDILWEPGCTYELPQLRVVNKGNLALAWDLKITGINGNAKLNEAIEWDIDVIVPVASMGTEGPVDEIFMGSLFKAPNGGYKLYPVEDADSNAYDTKESSMKIAISGHMIEEAGNEYQGLSIDGISVTVVATQLAAEYDSNGYEYDKNADYPYVSVNGVDYLTMEEAIAAAKPGDTVTLKGDITTKKQIVIDKNLTLELGTYTIYGTPEVNDNAVLRVCAPDKDTEITVTINATLGGIKTTGTNIMPIYAGHVELGKTNVIINGGDYESNCKWAVYQNNGTCTINGGSFKADGQSDTANGQPVYNSAVLDSFDSTPELTGKFVINGGKFYQFNPACLSVNKGDHHDHDSIAAGKTGILDEDGWFVVADGTLTYHIVCNNSQPCPAHSHCYASLADAEAALETNNCPDDVIVEGVGYFGEKVN